MARGTLLVVLVGLVAAAVALAGCLGAVEDSLDVGGTRPIATKEAAPGVEEVSLSGNGTTKEWAVEFSIPLAASHVPYIADAEFALCFDAAPDALQVRLAWEPSTPIADLEFRLAFPSDPSFARGASPLVWEHTLTAQDKEACADIEVGPDSTGMNVFVLQRLHGAFIAVYDGAALPPA